MDKFQKKIQTVTGKVRMRAEDKAIVRERIVSFMEYHPLTETTKIEKRTKRLSLRIPYTETFSFIYLNTWQARSAFAVFAVILLVGTPALAEQTLPGDVLYPMKVHINEEVLSQLSFTPYSKVTWETHRVERRISEARLLAQEGKLTDEVEAQITETVKEHTATAQKELQELRQSDADEAAVAQVAVDSALDVQSAVLDTADASSTGSEQISALADVVRDAKATLAPQGGEQTTLSSYERFSSEVEDSMVYAHELFDSIKDSITESERDEIDRRLTDVSRRISESRIAYEASSTNGAVQGLKDALGDTQKLISFMGDIDVRNSVSLETLVPKKLTVDERKALIVGGQEDLEAKVAQIKERLTKSDNPDIYEKAVVGLGDIEKDLAKMTEGIAAEGVLENAEAAYTEAQALVKDLLLLTGEYGGVVLQEGEATTSTPIATTTGQVLGTTTEATSTEEGTE